MNAADILHDDAELVKRMSLTFLFWNLRGEHTKSWAYRAPNLRASIANLAISRKIDTFCFAEFGFLDAEVIESLNSAGVGNYYAVASRNSRIRLFSRLENAQWKDRFNSQLNDRMTAHSLRVGKSRSILIVCVHGRDRMSVSHENDHASHAQDLADDIRLIQKDVGHQRTVVCGDFNMNPFELGMVAAKNFHALLSQNLTRTIHRLGRRAKYSCFFNPMWTCFGDRPNQPPGSYYFSNSLSDTNHFWHILDQVIIRPEIMGQLTRLAILGEDGRQSLVAKMGRPRKATFSDHLPLFFELTP